MNERYIALVDLGSSKIALTVARVDDGNAEVLYYDRVASDGIAYGSVRNPMKAAEVLKKALAKAESELGIKINQVVTGMPRCFIKQENTPAKITREDSSSCITSEEVENMKNMALDSYPIGDEKREQIYGAVAQSFAADDMIGAQEDDVIGVPSEILKGNFKVFVGPKRPVTNIDNMMNTAGVAIARKYFLPAAIGQAVLTRDELENGVGLLEIGCGVTSVSIFQKNILRYHASLPFGGKSISDDIQYEGGFSSSLAENIKLGFGSCLPDKLLNFGEKVIQIVNDEDGTYQNLTVKYLSEVITARVHEILQAAFFLIQKSGYADKLRSGLVVTGGCANLTNIVNMIREESGYSVRTGFPRIKHFAVGECFKMLDPGDAASAAMLLLAKEDQWVNCATESDATTQTRTVKPVVMEPAPQVTSTREKSPKGEATNAFQDWWERSDEAEMPAEKKEESVTVEAIQPHETEKVETKKKKKVNEGPTIVWGNKVVDGLENIFDKLLGKQFDNLGK